MPSTSDLHRFIHSLSKNEKGFFVKYSRLQGADKDYLKLFQAYCSLSSYDEKALASVFTGRKQSQKLSVTQNYLYRMLLRSLRLYYEKHDISFQLQNMLAEAKILEAKGFRKAANKILNKAKKIAERHHEYLIILEILKRQARLTVATKVKNILEETESVYQEVKRSVEFLEEELEYRKLSHQMMVCYRTERQQAPAKFGNLLRSISNHELLDQDYSPHSFYAQYLQYNIRALEARMYGDTELAFVYSKEIIDIWDQHPIIKGAHPKLYIIHVSNYLGLAINLKQVEHFKFYLAKIEGIQVHNMEDMVEQFQNVAFYKLFYYLNYNLLIEGKKLLPEINKGLQRYKGLINPARLMAIFYNNLVLFFVLEDFNQTLNWIDLILRKQKTEPRRDVKALAQVLEFVVHYELGNDLILHSLFASTARRLRHQKTKNEFEQIILTHFRKLLDFSSKKETLIKLKEFEEALLPLENARPKPLGLEELLYWLEARLTNRTIRQVFGVKSGTELNREEQS